MNLRNLVVWPLMLDPIPNNQVAIYSLRRVKTNYTGFCCEIRRGSDNTSTSVSFDSTGKLSLSSPAAGGTLGTWIGSNDGFIRQWFDQSGNANPVIQLTIANQPKIITAGVINTLGSQAAMTFNGSSTFLTSASTITMPATMSLFTISESINATLFIEHSPNVNSNDGFYIYGAGSAAVDVTRSAVSVQGSSPSWTGSSAVSAAMTYDGTTITAWKRNVSQFTGTGSLSGNTTQTLYVGARGGTSLFMTGTISEILLFNVNLTAQQRTVIVNSEIAFYGV